MPPTPAEGSRPLPTDRTIDGCPRKPPGRACPAPTVRRPGNGCPRKLRGRFHIPIRRAGCPHPAAASRCRPFPGKPQGAASPTPRGGLRCRQQQPLPSPSGEGGPAGPDEGAGSRCRPSPGYHPRRLPLPPTPAEGSRPLPTDRTIDGGLRNPPGRACPAPTVRRPGNGCPRKPHSVSISPSVGRGAPTPPRPSAAARPRANRRERRPRRPAEAPAAANTRGGVKTPPYGPNH